MTEWPVKSHLAQFKTRKTTSRNIHLANTVCVSLLLFSLFENMVYARHVKLPLWL